MAKHLVCLNASKCRIVYQKTQIPAILGDIHRTAADALDLMSAIPCRIVLADWTIFGCQHCNFAVATRSKDCPLLIFDGFRCESDATDTNMDL